MNDRTWRILCIINALLFVAAIVVSAVMGGCDSLVQTASGGEMPMKCHWTFIATKFIGVIGVISSVAMMGFYEKYARRQVSAINLVTIIVMGLLTTPFGIGICAKSDMHCHTTQLVLLAILAAILVLSVIMIAKAEFKEEGTEKPKQTI